MINVYGPVQGDKKERFLLELEKKIADQSHPILLGGDFNMIRCAKETVVRSIEDGWRDSMTLSQTRNLERWIDWEVNTPGQTYKKKTL